MNALAHIARHKQHNRVVILAHYYQSKEVKLAADFVGDSLAMAHYAADTTAPTIVVAAVRFMAETVALLQPDAEVLLPESTAGCSLADNCNPDAFRAFVSRYPNHVIVTYINSPVEVKALSDVICTSANAIKVIENIPKHKPIVFAPDKHLGAWLMQKTGRSMVLWDAECEVHADLSFQNLQRLKKAFPTAQVLAHPECHSRVLETADVIGSTSKLLETVRCNPTGVYIIATEAGIKDEMQQAAPNAKLIPLAQNTPNACACGECTYMKRTTLESIKRSLEQKHERITINVSTQYKAKEALQRMLKLSV